jgi:hypothetical protein
MGPNYQGEEIRIGGIALLVIMNTSLNNIGSFRRNSTIKLGFRLVMPEGFVQVSFTPYFGQHMNPRFVKGNSLSNLHSNSLSNRLSSS